jgi:hypothetical protein
MRRRGDCGGFVIQSGLVQHPDLLDTNLGPQKQGGRRQLLDDVLQGCFGLGQFTATPEQARVDDLREPVRDFILPPVGREVREEALGLDSPTEIEEAQCQPCLAQRTK